MPQVLCTLPNAAEEISGFKFTPVEGGVLSEEIGDETALSIFLSIPGYSLHGEQPAVAPDASDDAKAALLERAAAIGFAVKGNWGLGRLQKEVEEAEAKVKAAEEAAPADEAKAE